MDLFCKVIQSCLKQRKFSSLVFLFYRFIEKSVPASVPAPEKSQRRTDVLLYGVVLVRVHPNVTLGHIAEDVGRVFMRGGESAL